jgi:hypothetical protein
VRVADLHEERLAELRSAGAIARGLGEVDRGEDAARQGEERSGTSECEASERFTARGQGALF